MCGVARVHPADEYLTPRDVYLISEALLRSQWEQTSQVLAQLNNSYAKKKKKPSDFFPFSNRTLRGKAGVISGHSIESFRPYCKNTKGK